MNETEFKVTIDGKDAIVVLAEPSGEWYLKEQEITLSGAIIGKDGKPEGIKGESALALLKGQIAATIKTYPPGILSMENLFKQISKTDAGKLTDAVQKINDTRELQKK